MKKLTTFCKDLWKGEEGATMVEYGIMVALIAAVSIAVISTLGSKIQEAFSDTNSALP